MKLHDLHVERSRLEKNDPLWFIENEAKEIEKEANERTIKLRRLIDLRERVNDIKSKISEIEDKSHKIREQIKEMDKYTSSIIDYHKFEPGPRK